MSFQLFPEFTVLSYTSKSNSNSNFSFFLFFLEIFFFLYYLLKFVSIKVKIAIITVTNIFGVFREIKGSFVVFIIYLIETIFASYKKTKFSNIFAFPNITKVFIVISFFLKYDNKKKKLLLLENSF